jgi:hypothetical protein
MRKCLNPSVLLGRHKERTAAAAKKVSDASGNQNIKVEECDLASYVPSNLSSSRNPDPKLDQLAVASSRLCNNPKIMCVHFDAEHVTSVGLVRNLHY